MRSSGCVAQYKFDIFCLPYRDCAGLSHSLQSHGTRMRTPTHDAMSGGSQSTRQDSSMSSLDCAQQAGMLLTSDVYSTPSQVWPWTAALLASLDTCNGGSSQEAIPQQLLKP